MRISDWSSDVCSSDLAENESRKSDVGRDDPFSPALPPGLPVLSKTRFDFRDAAALRTRERVYDPLECCGLHRAELADRKSVGEGQSVSVRVDIGGRRIIKKEK